MQHLFLALVLLASASVSAAPCEPTSDSHWRLRSAHNVTYKPVVKAPGESIKVGGQKYIIVRVPFKEWKSGDRYAITYPVLFQEYDSYDFFGAFFNTTHLKGDSCSDVWIEGTDQSSHKQPVIEGRSVNHSARTYYDDPERNSGKLDVKRSLYTFLEFQIGETNGTVFFQVLREEIPEKDVPTRDYDLTDNINWDRLSDARVVEFSRLQTLARHVYITPLDD
ncbi:MAG: hypothetical protein ABJL54_16055 [Halioglobus sp.]